MSRQTKNECLRHLAASLREALTARFDPPNASVDRAASAAQIQQLVRQLPNDTSANTKKDE